jgi:hypothetical protein
VVRLPKDGNVLFIQVSAMPAFVDCKAPSRAESTGGNHTRDHSAGRAATGSVHATITAAFSGDTAPPSKTTTPLCTRP